MLPLHLDRTNGQISPRLSSIALSINRSVAALAMLTFVLLGCGRTTAQPQSSPAPSIGQQMEALWQGQAHFQEVRDIDWNAPPYSTGLEGAAWFAKPMPFAGGAWYLFSRHAVPKPSYCPGGGSEVVVRASSDEGRTWSNPGVVAAAPGSPGAPDACDIVDGSTYYDAATDTWHMLAQCLAAHNAGGWSICHYIRRGSSPMGAFVADSQPAITTGELWSRICADSHGACDPRATRSEGTPDIVEKRGDYFYVTFHGYSAPTGYRGVAKTVDFHHWIVAGSDLPDAPIVTPAECQAWNPGCIGGGESSTMIAGGYQYMLVETPSYLDLLCKPGQTRAHRFGAGARR